MRSIVYLDMKRVLHRQMVEYLAGDDFGKLIAFNSEFI